MTVFPANIEEFNTIAGLVFAQLYRAFPGPVDIDRPSIARAMDVTASDWSAHQLASGRTLGQAMAYTIGWLNSEEYIKSFGAHPAANVMLTEKGLRAMNVVPSGLHQSLGAELTGTADRAPSPGTAGRIGELIGGLLGGLTKSISSG